jgi:NTP pyrophosphatase (non-canonical NTP hydrolase)
MKNIVERNYKAVVNRGLIDTKTTNYEFFDKLQEENYEVWNSLDGNMEDLHKEIIDVMVVCMNWLRHHHVDIEKLLIENAIKNENRIRNETLPEVS